MSIIVPVYNVEEYLEECIESVLSSTYTNIEVILMDDGSTDHSAEVCKRYANEDSRIKLFKQQNQGVATARKNATKSATGEYIMFVDADDYIDIDFIEKLVSKAEGYDLVTSGYYNGHGKMVKCYDGIEEGAYSTGNEMKYVYSNLVFLNNTKRMGIHRSQWGKLFKTKLSKEIIEEINENIFWGEDGEFLYRYVLRCKSIRITRECGYHYRYRTNSAVHSVNKKYLKNTDAIYRALEPVFSNHVYSEVLLPQFQKWIAQMLNQVPYYLGFPLELQSTPYVYPDLKGIAGKDIIIYGAGNVGRSYKIFFERYGICNVKLWVDKSALAKGERYVVFAIEDIRECEYDYIIVAIHSEDIATEVMDELAETGIDRKKILWRKPIE